MRRAAKRRRVLTSLQPARPEARAEVPLWRGSKPLNEPSRRVEDLVRIEIPRCPPVRGRKHTQTAGPLGKSKHQQTKPRPTRQTLTSPRIQALCCPVGLQSRQRTEDLSAILRDG